MIEGLQTGTLRRIYSSIASRYDLQHAVITLGSDERGRELVVRETVASGDHVLDCGAGTGSTALLAARMAGEKGRVTLFDLSDDMLAVARRKLDAEGLSTHAAFLTGDMHALPFPDNSFDAVLSTYSLCPLFDPSHGALELLRVVKPGGKIGIAHSAEPEGGLTKRLADAVERLAWRFPWLSMGCRAVEVLPALEKAGARVLVRRRIGVPLWPFEVIVVMKPV